jgi:hypothetical protein
MTTSSVHIITAATFISRTNGRRTLNNNTGTGTTLSKDIGRCCLFKTKPVKISLVTLIQKLINSAIFEGE